MATTKSYTDLEQSKKLAEILPIESADNYYSWHDERYYVVNKDCPYPYSLKAKIPCWSLAALISILPAECECMSLEHINYGNNHKKYFMSYVGGGNTDIYDNPIDACVAMIERLHELKML